MARLIFLPHTNEKSVLEDGKLFFSKQYEIDGKRSGRSVQFAMAAGKNQSNFKAKIWYAPVSSACIVKTTGDIAQNRIQNSYNNAGEFNAFIM